MVGRMRPGRGHEWLLKTIPEVLKFVPRVYFFFVGRGDLIQKIRHKIDRKGYGSHVWALGFVPDPWLPEIYRILDVVLVLGIGTDGTARGLLEAMACGRPVIALNEGALADIIQSGKKWDTGSQGGHSQVVRSYCYIA